METPALLIQSAYDHWSMENILGVTCYSNTKSPYSIANCNDSSMEVINDYRDKSKEAIYEMIKRKPNTGAWTPSCIQHGFTTASSFNDQNFKVPGGTGKMMPEAIQ